MTTTEPVTIYTPPRHDFRRSWSPGIAPPFTLAAAITAAALNMPVILIVILAGSALLSWLAAPIWFWVWGAAPTITTSEGTLHITTKRGTTHTDLDALQRVELTRGGWEGHIFTKNQAWPRLTFIWREEAAPGHEGFPKEVAFDASLPVLGKRRMVVLRAAAAQFAELGLPAVLADLNPPEHINPPTT